MLVLSTEFKIPMNKLTPDTEYELHVEPYGKDSNSDESYRLHGNFKTCKFPMRNSWFEI